MFILLLELIELSGKDKLNNKKGPPPQPLGRGAVFFGDTSLVWESTADNLPEVPEELLSLRCRSTVDAVFKVCLQLFRATDKTVIVIGIGGLGSGGRSGGGSGGGS